MTDAVPRRGDAESGRDGGGAHVRRLAHATVLVGREPTVVVVDAWRWRLRPAADAALVTHGHADHCSEDDIEGALRGEGPVAAPLHLEERLSRSFPGRVVALLEGDSVDLLGARVTALPAAGVSRGGATFHARGRGLAYLVETPDVRALCLGDSVVLPEHEGLAADVAFVAVGGMVTATPEEAAEDVGRLGARCVVPVHWGDLEGRYEDALRFVRLCRARGVRAAIEPPPVEPREPGSAG